MKQLSYSGDCLRIKLLNVLWIYGDTDTPSLRVYAERRFEQMVPMLGDLSIKAGICIEYLNILSRGEESFL